MSTVKHATFTCSQGFVWQRRPDSNSVVFSPASDGYQETEADRFTMCWRSRLSSTTRWSEWNPIPDIKGAMTIFDALLGSIASEVEPTTAVGNDGPESWTDPKTGRVWDRGPEPGQVVSDGPSLRRVFRFAESDLTTLEWRFRKRTYWEPVKSEKWAEQARAAILAIWWPSTNKELSAPVSPTRFAEPGEFTKQVPGPSARTAASFLDAALGHMVDRATTYDRPQGERSMGNCVQAFNTITGHALSEEQGWLFMALLKIVRTQQGAFRADNYEDLAAYAGLAGESAAKSKT